MKRNRAEKRPNHALLNATYYGVLSISVVVGLVAYTTGATLEGILVRVALSLLAFTVLGYVVNIILCFSVQERQTDATTARAGATGQADEVGAKIDLVAGDDLRPKPSVAASKSAI